MLSKYINSVVTCESIVKSYNLKFRLRHGGGAYLKNMGVKVKNRNRNAIKNTILTSVIIPIAHGFEIIQPIGHSLNLKIFTLNNWAIPANPDKEERLKELRTVLRNESFDIFILQGLWMEYDHAAIQAAGCSGLSIVYKNNGTTKQSSSFNLYTYRGSIFTTDGTLGKGIGRLRLKIQSFIVEIFATHVHDSDVYYQDFQTRELMSYVSKSPADLIILGAALQSTPSERPYRNIMTFDDTTKIINTGQNYFPSNWNDPNAHVYCFHCIHNKRIICYVLLTIGLLFAIFSTVFVLLNQNNHIRPVTKSIQLKIYSLNNWAIPGNPDKEERLKELRTVLRNESFDIFILQGLWMEYDHTSIREALPSDKKEDVVDYLLSTKTMVLQNEAPLLTFTPTEDPFFTTDGTLGKGIGRLHLQTRELMSYVSKSPADLIILGAAIQSTPNERGYRNIMTYDATAKISNTAQKYFPSNWNDPNAHAAAGSIKNKKKSNEHISFHRFPKEVNERNKWRIAVRRKGWKPTDSSRICSIHFKDEDYIEGLQRRVLTPGAIPSIFPSFPPHLQRVENKRRVLVRNNIQKLGLQNNETSNKCQRSSIPLIMPPYKPPPSKPITETEHNYSYPNDINILKNRCNMLKETLEKMITQNKQLKIKVKWRDSKIKKLNNNLENWIKKNVLSIETISNLKRMKNNIKK
ncbi:unnamed protein product [Lepeophtheirus salmonis]|uniref:(salmon louse) hypothetical protein n=1 Tax=Lepeophtheirus salmonis TaxID=72036 RepID=A0A7R8CMY0_LEPSM|nr:unnamed protein product [Lepeophtheirus salmonis]CAF2837242.1 unnamed protein product [Lepeophtheirus salmonis]